MHATRQVATARAACEHGGRSHSGRNEVLPRPRAIIAEDEPLLREELAELLGSLWPELDIVAQTGDGIATLREIEAHAPDVLFLDIQMPGLTGLEVARQVSGRCHVVFVTAYDQHTLAAFEQGAADYVLKPADAARLATTVARLKERVGRPAPAIALTLTMMERWICQKYAGSSSCVSSLIGFLISDSASAVTTRVYLLSAWK
jgi:DNA-binding LytR/AlgR family response regulator